MEISAGMIALFVPIAVIQLGLQVYSLVHLSKSQGTSSYRLKWSLIIILGGIIGPVLYLVFKKK